jgi:polyisoprenoid-binding protein YceI
MMISTVKGRFSGVAGTIEGDLPNLTTARIEATIDVATIDTREAQRDGHLRSADFFDAEKFPQITFRSTRIHAASDNEYKLAGDLTIRGVTREVVLDATFEGIGKDPWGNERAGFSAEATIDRKDFGLVWNAVLETGGILVGDKVKMGIQVEAIRQVAQVTA